MIKNVNLYFIFFKVFFSEICLLAKLKRTASVKADTFCNLYSLEYSDFHSVLGEFENMRYTIEQVARDRLRKIGRVTDSDFKRGQSTRTTFETHFKLIIQFTWGKGEQLSK